MADPGRSSWAARAGVALMVAGGLLLVLIPVVRWASDGFTDDVATVEPLPGPSGSLPTVGSTPTDSSGSPAGVEPVGFTTIQARITGADGEVCEVCLWLADDATERSQGLMGVTDLGDAVGMAFVFDDPRLGRFWMFQTPAPLSIAWFAGGGDELVAVADMEPCLGVPTDWCKKYSPQSEYDLAIEVFQGGLESLGIGPGSSIELIDGSEADRCPVVP